MGAEKWFWWVGTADAVDDDATYDLGSFSTREEAIRSGIRDTDPGDAFYIIEARTGGYDADRDEDDREPFIEARNGERLLNDWAVVERGSGDAAPGFGGEGADVSTLA